MIVYQYDELQSLKLNSFNFYSYRNVILFEKMKFCSAVLYKVKASGRLGINLVDAFG